MLTRTLLAAVVAVTTLATIPGTASADPHRGRHGHWDNGRHRGWDHRGGGWDRGHRDGYYSRGYYRAPPPAYYAPARRPYYPPPGVFIPFR